MHARSIPKVPVATAIVGAALVMYVAPGASAPDRRVRANEYPLAVIAASTVPRRPKAGKAFTAEIKIVNQETNELLEWGEVACPARIGHRGLRPSLIMFVIGRGIARCIWTIPAKTGGKRMEAKVAVQSEQGTVRSRFLRVVRP